MKVITIEELEKLAPGEATIVDVRPEEEFRRGTFEGAINIPMKEFSDRMDEIPKDKPVWLLCHTGASLKSSENPSGELLPKQYRNTISSSRGTRSQSAFPAVRILCLWQSFYRNCSVMENILLNWYFWS